MIRKRGLSIVWSRVYIGMVEQSCLRGVRDVTRWDGGKQWQCVYIWETWCGCYLRAVGVECGGIVESLKSNTPKWCADVERMPDGGREGEEVFGKGIWERNLLRGPVGETEYHPIRWRSVVKYLREKHVSRRRDVYQERSGCWKGKKWRLQPWPLLPGN